MLEKSPIDQSKEQGELRAFERAVYLSRGKKKMTRDILSLLNGEAVEREKLVCPDIIRKKKMLDGTELLIGIEHFLVEQVSEIKGGSCQSILKINRSYIEKMFENQRKLGVEDRNRRSDLTKVNNTIFDSVSKANTTGIPELKETFCRVYHNHLSKIPEYRVNLQRVSSGRPIKLAFLIELHCNADDIFLNNGRTVEHRTNHLYPVMRWISDEFEKSDPMELDYIVILFINSLDNDIADTIAIETIDVQGSFRKQGIPVYEYCDKVAQIRYINHGVTEDGIGHFSTEVTNVGTYSDEIVPALIRAYEFKSSAIPFVAPRDVQAMLSAFGRARIITTGSRKQIKSEYSKAEALQRFDEFVEKYSCSE